MAIDETYLKLLNTSVNRLGDSLQGLRGEIGEFREATVKRFAQGEAIFDRQNEQLKRMEDVASQIGQLPTDLKRFRGTQRRLIYGVCGLALLVVARPEFWSLIGKLFALFVKI